MDAIAEAEQMLRDLCQCGVCDTPIGADEISRSLKRAAQRAIAGIIADALDEPLLCDSCREKADQ